jgi:menaquinone-9 beta-reductase
MMAHDAAIVGGGPAGCSAAITLAERGAKVVLFEAKTYPHHKVCGEFLSPECSAALEALGVMPMLHALGRVQIETVRITAPDGTSWQTRFPGVALGISRSALDATLAERARRVGVDVCEATTVSSIDGNLCDGFELELRTPARRLRVRARTVIAAHGKRGTLDRSLNRQFLTQPQPFVALKNHFHGPRLPHHIDLHAFRGGYCGMSEIEGGWTNVCFLAHESVFRAHDVESFLGWLRAQNPLLGHWLSQAEPVHERWLSIGQVPFARKNPLAGDILMAGDSAGLIVPLAGDGIAMALHSGTLAASHIADYLYGQLSAEQLRRRYQREWQRQFGARLALARALQIVVLRPRLLSLGLRLIAAVPPLGNYLVTHTRGC